MFISSVFLYLAIRKATLLDISTELVNLASFLIPIFLYLPMAILNKSSLTLSPYQLFIMIILSVIGSYLPNVASLNSVKFAPNPGYSLVLSKSYVVFTTIAALFVFHAALSLKSSLAILMIVGFSVLIMIGKTKLHKHSNPLWLPLSFGAFFGWGFLSLGTKYAFTIGINIYQRLIYLAIFVSIYILLEMFVRKTKLHTVRFSELVLL